MRDNARLIQLAIIEAISKQILKPKFYEDLDDQPSYPFQPLPFSFHEMIHFEIWSFQRADAVESQCSSVCAFLSIREIMNSSKKKKKKKLFF